MNWTPTQPDLHFEHRPRPRPRRLVVVGATLAIFTLMWVLFPPGVLYWLLLLPVGILAWMASYGWRDALRILIITLNRMEQL